ncbi:DUF3795 domain-containing protein [Bacteroides rodentium]|uniref:DUF3795 domain-containing protein n=1 Tax=Bacteroides rodentium TaxID=691816 RepID=UPI000471FE26|nr:DUF3795 domain-containing protein [Bacteroides rodentium]
MKQLIACCGLDCENCAARIATVNNDDELREKTAKEWSVLNNTPEITAETIHCMGYRADGVKFAYCSNYCAIRKCVYEKGFNTCGDCKELDTCQVVGTVLQHAPGARENLY